MDREELTALIKQGPIRIRMNDGRAYEVPGIGFASVGDFSAAVLYRAEDGKYRHMHLPLVTMAGVEPLNSGA